MALKKVGFTCWTLFMINYFKFNEVSLLVLFQSLTKTLKFYLDSHCIGLLIFENNRHDHIQA